MIEISPELEELLHRLDDIHLVGDAAFLVGYCSKNAAVKMKAEGVARFLRDLALVTVDIRHPQHPDDGCLDCLRKERSQANVRTNAVKQKTKRPKSRRAVQGKGL